MAHRLDAPTSPTLALDFGENAAKLVALASQLVESYEPHDRSIAGIACLLKAASALAATTGLSKEDFLRGAASSWWDIESVKQRWLNLPPEEKERLVRSIWLKAVVRSLDGPQEAQRS